MLLAGHSLYLANMSTGLRYFPDTPVNQSLGLVGKLKYWHPFALRYPMREIAARYPITYKKVGETIEALGFDLTVEPSKAECSRMMLAIIAAMPPHIIPYGSMGDDRPWALIDWTSLVADLS